MGPCTAQNARMYLSLSMYSQKEPLCGGWQEGDGRGERGGGGHGDGTGGDGGGTGGDGTGGGGAGGRRGRACLVG
jgi:hypothetical protein